MMAKEPVPGRVKTRLCPPCSPQEAAAIAGAALSDTLEAVSGCGADRLIVALDGEPGPWLPPGFEVIRQRGHGLAARLANAWADALADGGGPGIQVGMDTPQVRAWDLDHLLGMVAPGRAVLGHAVDGGWWVIGLTGVDPAAVFDGVPMSTPMTGDRQEQRLRALGLSVWHAPRRRDMDTYNDLVAVAAEATGSRTATVAAALGIDRAVADAGAVADAAAVPVAVGVA